MRLVGIKAAPGTGAGQCWQQTRIFCASQGTLREKISPLAVEKAKKAVETLNRLLEMDYFFGAREQGFKKSLETLRETITGLRSGAEPAFRKYTKDDVFDIVVQNRAFSLDLRVEDGKPVLCPELGAVLNTALYMMNERQGGKLGLMLCKTADGSHQLATISGSGIKCLGKETPGAIESALELMGCSIKYNGTSMTIWVPLARDGAEN
ncbi:MAG: hypothetical protein WCY41_04060 [Candidatus Micrarchaeia archaeon]